MEENKKPDSVPTEVVNKTVSVPEPAVGVAPEAPMPPVGPVEGQKPKQSNNAVTGIIIAVAVILVIVVGAIAVTSFAAKSSKEVPVFSKLANTVEKQQWNSSENYREKTAKAMYAEIEEPMAELVGKKMTIEEMQEELKDFETSFMPKTLVSYAFDMTIDVEADGSEYNFVIEGTSMTDEDSSEMEAIVNFDLVADSTTYKGEAELKTIDTDFYFKLNSVPNLGIDVSEYMNQWYFMDTEAYAEQYASTAPDAEELADYEITQEGLDALEAVMTHPDFYNSIKLLDDRTFDGVVTKCYEVTLDEKKLENLVNAGAKAYDEDYKDLSESETDPFDMVIVYCSDRAENNPYYFSATVTSDSDVAGKLTMEANMYDYGVDSKIEAPKDTKDVMEVIQSIMSETSFSYDDSYDYDNEYEYDYDYEDEYDSDYDFDFDFDYDFDY
jgi:hypothetical protein